MSVILTTLAGIALLFVSLFCAFGAGIDTERRGSKEAGGPILASLFCAFVAILFLLARS